MPTAPHTEPGPRPEDGSGRPSDVLAMHRLARRADGGAALLEWLGRRAGSWAGLVDRSGAVLLPAQAPPVDAAVFASGVAQMRRRGLPAYSVDGDAHRVALLAVEAAAGAQNPFLAVVDPPQAAAVLLSDAAVLLATSWSALHARRTVAQVQRAEARCREAVLHLLMGQHLVTARQLASALSPALPETTRVHVIETSAARRGEVVDRCAELTGGNAWIVRCPVYSRHVIVLADGAQDPADPPLDRAVATELPGCTVGAGDAVALRETAVGYEQAFHALAVARRRPERWARFDAALDIASVLGADGSAWAESALTPLVGHVPARATDPDADELITTARSWLAFSTGASRQLTIHRNTLALRLKRIEDLLGVDLARLDQQAWLDLALRIRSAPGRAEPDARYPDPPPDPDDLLRSPGAQRWAEAVLRPVRRSAHAPQLEATLRAWLDTGARLSATADALQLSIAGARRRIERLEQVLHRSLLHGPSARNDLWLALRAADLGSPEHGHQ